MPVPATRSWHAAVSEAVPVPMGAANPCALFPQPRPLRLAAHPVYGKDQTFTEPATSHSLSLSPHNTLWVGALVFPGSSCETLKKLATSYLICEHHINMLIKLPPAEKEVEAWRGRYIVQDHVTDT